jgi:phosphatidylinositol alpha-1,6-mannosyltransferase
MFDLLSSRMSEPRVLAITPDFPPATGGIQYLTHRLLRHLSLDKFVVTLDDPHAEAFDLGDSLRIRRVRRLRSARRASMLLLNARAVGEALGFRPDVVLSGHILTSPGAWAIARALHVPVVQYFYAKEIAARPRLATFALRHAVASIGISGYTLKLLLALGAEPDHVHLIPPGVDLPHGRPDVARSSAPTLLTVARLEDEYKGHDVVIRAMPLISARVPDVQWIVVGDGPLRPRLECLAADKSVTEHVRFVGGIPDAERDLWFDRAHVFLMPSRLPARAGGEGFGIAYLEAAAHGLPVVAGNVAGAPDAVLDGKTGILVDPTDPAAVADAASRLLLDRDMAETLGQAGAARAEQFAWPVVANQVEQLLVRVVADTR